MTPQQTDDEWDEYLRQVNSRYNDEGPPEPSEDVVELSGEDAIEIACILAEYSQTVEAEYNWDTIGGWEWVRELMCRAGVDEPHEPS